MKVNRNWIMLIILGVIISITTYYSFSYASSTETPKQHEYNSLPMISEGEDWQNNEKELSNTNIIPVSNKTYEDESDEQDYMEATFIDKEVQIGDGKDVLLKVQGEPNERGMYQGGYYFDYGMRTYFVNPETEKINAIAVPKKYLNMDKWKESEKSLLPDLKLEGLNEMDGLWMEIYDWREYDVMIEREQKGDEPFCVWLLEDSLFTD
ncbi:hypothetical protein QA612_18750 [Evansella sp. AB-P1]|uniref:hypothetical protein n=1 Tax=Evansella sp. AB-P1 TaxID=3037653 RepID=UPI00241C9D66|nr:hypothetical protein [Evansella sp. AB-P1]MDG5789502.1 hypothetical protein [Evansella sp. AB-P1]